MYEKVDSTCFGFLCVVGCESFIEDHMIDLLQILVAENNVLLLSLIHIFYCPCERLFRLNIMQGYIYPVSLL